MTRFTTLLTAFALSLSFLTPLPSAQAGCGCEKPPPAPAAVRPNVTYAGMPVTLFSSSLVVGRSYTVRFLPPSGPSTTVAATAVSRRDVADGVTKPQLRVPLPTLPLGPVGLTVTASGESAPFLSVPDTDLTVAPAPVVVPSQVGAFSYQGYQAAVGRDGRVYLSLDVTHITLPRTFRAQAKGYPLRFTADTAVFYNPQGFLMQLANAPIPGLFSVASGSATDSDIAQYARHEFTTYFLQHAEQLSHGLDPADANWHTDGTRHIDHDHLILALAGTVNGAAPAPGATPPFTLALGTASFFTHGVVGADSVSVTSQATLDSTHSGTGTPGADGDVRSNGSLLVDSNAVIYGDATAAQIKVGRRAKITGQQTLTTQKLAFLPVDLPRGLTHLGSLQGSNSARTLTTGSYQLSELVLDSGAQLLIDNTTGPVTLYITGEVRLGSGAQILVADPTPEKFALYVAGTGPVTFSSESEFYGVVYAPKATVTLSGKGQFTGSFVAKNAAVSGTARLHYDTALQGR